MYHDSVSKNVWRSTDEGKGWKVIDGVPHGEAMMLVDHPFDTKIVSLGSMISSRCIVDWTATH